MRVVVIQLPKFLHDYLLEVQRRNTHSGLEPEELGLAAQLWEASTTRATVLSDTPAATDVKVSPASEAIDSGGISSGTQLAE